MSTHKQQIIYANIPDQIASKLKDEILQNHQHGSRLPTVVELAKRFQVSTNTMGKVLEVLAREGLVQKRRGRGVHVIREVRPLRVGILSELDLFDSRISTYWRSAAGALKSQLEAAGCIPQLYIGHAEPGPGASDEPTCPRFWTDAEAGKLDGAVILDVPSTDAWYARVRSCPIPVVGGNTNYQVAYNLDEIIVAAVKRLAAQGCRRLGLMSWRGAAGFRPAVAACGLTASDAWIRTDLDPAVCGAGWDEFREIWLSAGEKPDGLVILDDMLAADAQLAIFELGVRVPQDLRLIVATSRNASPTLRLPLTAIESDPAEVAAELKDLLLKRMRGELSSPVTRHVSYRELAAQEGPAAVSSVEVGARDKQR